MAGGLVTGTRYDQPEPALEAPTLFDPPPLAPMPTLEPVDPPGTQRPPATIQEAFDRFHQANPWVAVELRGMALDLVDAGHERVGIGMLFEVLRWRYMRATTDTSSTFRLNNNYRSRYARLLADECPALDGVFETRRLHTA